MKDKNTVTVERIHTKKSLSPSYIIRPKNKSWYIHIESSKFLPDNLDIEKVANYIRMLTNEV